MLGSWWCCCGDEWVARRELALAMVTAEAGKSSVVAAGEEETEKMQMVRAGQCGRVLARLRHALACLGHTRRGASNTRHPLAPRGAQALIVSATERCRSVRQSPEGEA